MDSRFVLLFLSLAFLAQSQDAYYALTNTISDSPSVSVHFSQGANVVANVPVAYQAYIDYKPIPAGSYNISIHLENGTSVGVVQQQALAANTRYTMATVGVVSAAPEIVVQTDDLTAPSGPNVVRVRVFNGITNAGAIDVQFSQYRSFNATAYKSFTGFVEMGAGTPEVTVFRTGTNTQIGVRTKVILNGGSLVTLFLEGASENVAVISAQVQQVSQYATVRVAHLLKNVTSNVDVFLGANKVASDLAFKGISQVSTVLYSTQLIIREAGKDTLVWNTTLGGAFNDRDQFLIALMGVLSENGLKLVVVEDDITPPANGISGRIRFAHAVPELGAVDVKLNGASLPFNISFGDITTPMEMGISNYSAEFFYAADGKHVFTVPTIINVASGADSIVFIAGSAVGDAEVFQATTVAYQYAYVRFAHTSFGTPAAQPQVIPQGVDAAVTNGTIFPALTYGQFSNYTQVLVVPWTVNWIASGVSLTDSFSITLASQTYYTVTLEGLETGVDRLAVGVVSDDLTYPAGPDATAVIIYNQVAQSIAGGKNINIDVYLNGQRYAENLPFSTGSNRNTIQPGVYNMTVYMSGTGEMLTAPMNVTLVSGGVIGIWIAGQYINSSMTENKISAFTDLNARYTYVHLRVSNQVAGAPAGDVAVYMDSDYQSFKLFDNVAFGTISPYTYFITQGIFKIRLANAGGTIASVLYNPSIGDELAIVYGLFNNMTDLTVLKNQGVETPDTPMEFVVRFVHTAPYVGPVNLVVNGNNVSINLAYGSATGWITLPANVVYRVDVVVNGQLALFAANLTFAAGSVNTAFVTGVPARVQVEKEATYTFWEFRVVHALFSGPAVTVNVDGAPKVPSVSYGTVSSYYWVQSGARIFSVLAGTDLLFEGTFTQTAGTFNFLISGNTLAAGHNSFELVSAGIVVPTASNSRVKLVNVYSTYPAVTVEGNSNTTLADDLEYLESTDYLEMASGYNTFAVLDVNATARHELTNLTLRLMEGHSYSLFIMGGMTYAQIVQVEDYVPVEVNKIRHLNAFHQDVTNNAVAAYVNGQYVQDVAYQTVSAYYDVPVGKFNITPVEYRKQNQIELLGAMSITGFKEAFTAFVFPMSGVSTVRYVKDDLTLPEDGKIRVRIFNLIDGLPMIHQVKFGDSVVFANVSYGDASHEAVLDEATYSVEISSETNGTLMKADYDLRSSGAAAFTMAAIGTPSNFKIVTFLDAGVGYTPAASSSKSGGLPGWAIALIVIGCIVFIAAVAVAGWMIYKRRRQGYATIPDRDA